MTTWRKITIQPKSRSGKIYKIEGYSPLGVPFYSEENYYCAYTNSDVVTFFFDKQNEAVASGICTEENFKKFNSNFINSVNEIDEWPIASCTCLGDLYIPVSDEQLKYEKIKPFLDKEIFPLLDLEMQLITWELVDENLRPTLLEQLTEDQQKSLFAKIATQ